MTDALLLTHTPSVMVCVLKFVCSNMLSLASFSQLVRLVVKKAHKGYPRTLVYHTELALVYELLRVQPKEPAVGRCR